MAIVSESRAAAADTGYRVSYPNSRPRALALVGLGTEGARIATRVGQCKLQHLQTLIAESPLPGTHERADTPNSLATTVQAIAAEGHRLGEALAHADMIFLVATPADDLTVAAEIGQFGRQGNVLITGILVLEGGAAASKADAALERMRAASDMLVIVSDAGYVLEMVSELGVATTANVKTP